MRFVLLDESTAVGNGSAFGGPISPGALADIAGALTVQLNRDLATWWGGNYAVRPGANRTDIASGEIACALLDSLPNAPDDVAYHDVVGKAVPVIFLARTQCNSIVSGSDSVSGALSHEALETAGDPDINVWRDDNAGFEWAQELSDAVQEANYLIDKITVSDFVLPKFFAPAADGPFDYLATVGTGAISAPFATMPGGYQIKRPSGGGSVQVHGTIAGKRRAKKSHPTSRTFRRGVRL